MSTTERHSRERGQALGIFVVFLFVLLGAAALAFDTGMVMLEKRSEQNAADAAALAGARFLPGNTATATTRARAIATKNGYTHGVGGVTVSVNFPSSGRIEVNIGNTRASIFSSLFGITDWTPRARAVAANQTSSGGGFAMLALDPTGCPSTVVEGSGTIRSNGNIQVNSSCTSGDRAFRVAGNGGLYLEGAGIGCNVVGDASYGGGVSHNDCNPANTGADYMPDPYAWPNLGYPMANGEFPGPPPALPAPIEIVSGTGSIPAACPGGTTPATHAAPAKCNFGGSYDASKTWRLHPGYYPGGINLQGGNFLLEAGVYYIGGGGFRAANVGLTSVDGGTTLDHGVLIFNTTHPSVAAGQVVLQGGVAQMNLYPLSAGEPWDNFVVFQDRSVTLTVEIVGGNSDMQVRGVVYAPAAQILVQGNAGAQTMDQLIGYRIRAAGNGGTITVAYDENFLPGITLAGLIE